MNLLTLLSLLTLLTLPALLILLTLLSLFTLPSLLTLLTLLCVCTGLESIKPEIELLLKDLETLLTVFVCLVLSVCVIACLWKWEWSAHALVKESKVIRVIRAIRLLELRYYGFDVRAMAFVRFMGLTVVAGVIRIFRILWFIMIIWVTRIIRIIWNTSIILVCR